MKNSAQGRALAQAVAKIHWSIAYSALDALLAQPDTDPPPTAEEISAALKTVDEALAELRAAFGPKE